MSWMLQSVAMADLAARECEMIEIPKDAFPLSEPIAVWPDGAWCYMDELDAYLTWRSDDFVIIEPKEDEK